MYLNWRFAILTLLAFSFAGCLDVETVDNCKDLRSNFDDHVLRSRLPIFENPDSLCHGMNMGTDFSGLEPRWAVGKLIEVDSKSNALVFEGANLTSQMFWPASINEWDYEVGSYYKVDMNNICRSFFMMADSRYPSPISATFVKPKKVNCANEGAE